MPFCRGQICTRMLSLYVMGHKKLIRFAELETFHHVLQFPKDMPGKWHSFFHNNNPITLELACGKGEYTLGLAKLYPNRNFVGVDIKGSRIWVGAKKALRENLANVGFLRTQIDQLAEYFDAGEVAEIWITFPDPQLRFSKARKRLTHPKFLRLYQQLLAPGGVVHLKTDSPDLYQFTKLVLDKYHCTILEESDNVYAAEKVSEELMIRTHYEALDIAGSNRIHYLRFTLPSDLGGKEEDEALKAILREHEGID